MSYRRKSGWFGRIIRVAATVSAFLVWTDYCLGETSCADVELKPNSRNEASSLYFDGRETVVNLPKSDDIIDRSGLEFDDAECITNKQVASTSKCDIFYILVSTIDGKMSALDLHNDGSLAWSVEADSRPLYSSSLANMEMIRHGKKMRLIPSLDGALYQFDGEKVEAIPMSAETLLSSTHRLSDDAMIVGSKDLRNFGINLRTGEVQYTCGSDGCSNTHGETKKQADLSDSTIVLTRSTQVVRSVDIKHGNEKWNFSVGQHQLNLLPPKPQNDDEEIEDDVPLFSSFNQEECSSQKMFAEVGDYENSLRLVVPEGRVVALSKADTSNVKWEHKFASPIAKAWLLRYGKLEPMSLFDGRHIPTLGAFHPDDLENESMHEPLLYIGSHQKLLYIQPSPEMELVLKSFTNLRIGHVLDPSISVSWRPYLNTASVRTPIFGGNRQHMPERDAADRLTAGNTKTQTSLTVWHEDYPFDTGYFLYPEFRDTRSVRRGVMLIDNIRQRSVDGENLGIMDTLPSSLWNYWKEVIAISVIVSVAVHILLTRCINSDVIQSADSSSTVNEGSKNSNGSSNGSLVASSDSNPLLQVEETSSNGYVSRFATDFECLHCLGKGGFGVVFEAVNRVDDQHYAVKRTMLPKSDGAKEKVLREVRALAKLEHIGIVRYFNAWVESPPAEWQEEKDKEMHFSDLSGPTSCSVTQSCAPLKEQFTPERIRQKKPREIHRSEATLDTDSILFASDCSNADGKPMVFNKSGSGEFSVHSNFSELSDVSESYDIHTDVNKKLCSSKASLQSYMDGDLSDTSMSDAGSNIPFSIYTKYSPVTLSSQKYRSRQCKEETNDSVVFQDTNNAADDHEVCENSKNPVDNHFMLISSQDIGTESEDGHSISEKHDYIVDITDSEKSENKEVSNVSIPGTKYFLYIQMQLYRKDTLKDWLSNNTLNRDRPTILDIFDQIVCAVHYVHKCGLMHRDLKPSNIFFSADGIVKVGDFGLVTALSVQQDQTVHNGGSPSDRHTAEVGTTLYMSPEQISRKPYDLKVDIFSLGLIFLELWIPFSTQMERITTLQDAKRQKFPSNFTREMPNECQLVRIMTSVDPSLRPVTQDVLDHPILKDLAPTRISTHRRSRTVSDNSNN